MLPFPQPTDAVASEQEVYLGYLAFFRSVVIAKIGELPAAERSRSLLPSQWTPLELLNHLRHVERRWLQWGFAGEPLADPWADAVDGRWRTSDDFATLAALSSAQAEVTRQIVLAHGLDDVGAPGERWDGASPPTLRRVLLHLLQEYARHSGHLDIVCELAGGSVGEAG